MQNYVYPTRETALAAPHGRLVVAVCRDCGFAWNREFDPAQLAYDAGYDNAVPSAVMDAHYRETAAYLAREYDLDGGLVVDIGCGNGGFLKTLCSELPTCSGLRDRSRAADAPAGRGIADSLAAYATSEAGRIEATIDQLRRYKQAGRAIGIWGMATKGVVFSVLADPERSLIDLCLDINANKHGAFVPLTGHMITSPDALLDRAFAQPPLLVVMNENYRDEIERICQELGVEPILANLDEM